MTDCIFCKIVKGELPCYKVYGNEKVIAFLDIQPVVKGHVLVIPKEHTKNIFTASSDTVNEVMKVVHKIACALEHYSEGVNIGSNNNEVAGQFVFHLHFHVLPRYADDGLKSWPGSWPSGKYKEGEAEKIAEEIRKLLE